jgi:NAD(P)-dependent dehydrogenase (short-subunit alcohol dehydrogenase family)
MKLKNKVALVTGGTSGIGRATAKLFRDEGAHVVVTGANLERLEEVSREFGPEALVLQADLRVPRDIDALVAAIRGRFGYLDILFANAGKGLAAPLEAVTEAQIDEQFAVNFKGLFFTVQKTAPLLGKGGSIVLTTSFLNEVGTPGLSILSATKAAVRSLARSLGAELAPRGIRVNAVSPGPISTLFHGKLGLSEQDLRDAAASIEAQVPLQRFGEAHEVAKAALFLASEDSSFVTGTELVVVTAAASIELSPSDSFRSGLLERQEPAGSTICAREVVGLHDHAGACDLAPYRKSLRLRAQGPRCRYDRAVLG